MPPKMLVTCKGYEGGLVHSLHVMSFRAMSEDEVLTYLVAQRVGPADGAAADDQQPRNLLLDAGAVNTG